MKRIPILLALLSTLAPACRASEPFPTISPEELVAGQPGYGLSVFSGTEPERFEVEILGVVTNSRPELTYIMARLKGKDLERSGIVAGMSGSPVFVDGRLAGAVAFSYLFGLDPIAGITPIGPMRALGSIAAPRLPPGTVGTAVEAKRRPVSPVAFEDLVRRDFGDGLAEKLTEGLHPRTADDTRSAIVWSATGFGERSTKILEGAVGEIAPWGATAVSGGSAAAAAEPLRPGSAVAAVLVRGDLNLAAHGTVTDRRGDEVMAFGHPVFGIGRVKLPMAAAQVVAVYPSRYNSFKISNAGPVVGAFDEDRTAGAHGVVGAEAPMAGVDVRLRGLVERDFHMEVVREPLLQPNMVALSALGALESGSYATGFQSLDMTARFVLSGYGDLVVKQSFDGVSAGVDSVLYLLSFGGYLVGNGFAEVDVEKVDIDYVQVAEPRLATILSAHADRTRIEPGQTVRVFVELEAYRGERFRRTLEVTVPEATPDGPYYVLVGDGTSIDAARLLVEQRTPQSFEQALEYLRALSSRRELKVLGLLPRPGLAVAGEPLPGLPGSVRSIFSAAPSSAGTPLGYAITLETSRTEDRPLTGALRVDLQVKRR